MKYIATAQADMVPAITVRKVVTVWIYLYTADEKAYKLEEDVQVYSEEKHMDWPTKCSWG